MLVPSIEIIHLGEPLHAGTVGAHALHHGGAAILLLDFVGAATYFHRGRKSLQIPFPGTHRGFVEIVDVEYQSCGRGAEDTKITDMRVAYTLHRYPGYRRGRQIVGHDEHCAAIERERAGAHTLVPQRNQFGHADGGLLLQKADRLSPALLRLPNGMGIQWRLGSSGYAGT